MEKVQDDALSLTRALESRDNFRVRDAAANLKATFQSAAVSRMAPLAGDPEFQRLLGDAIAALDRVRAKARDFDAEALVEMRGEITASCDACHSRFREP